MDSKLPHGIPAELESFLLNAQSLCAAVIRDGHIAAANQQLAQAFGYPNAADLAGRSWDSLFEQDSSLQHAAGHFNTGCILADGTVSCGEVTITKWASDAGLALAIIRLCSKTDSGHSDCVHPNCQGAEHYRTLVEQAVDGIFLCDENGLYTDINTSGCAMLGYTREELRKLGPLNVTPPDQHARLAQELQTVRTGATSFASWTMLRKDGSTFPAEVSASMLSDGRMLGILRDLTTRIATEEQLSASRELLRQFVERTPAAVAMFDKNMRYVLYSKRWLADYKLGDRDLTGLLHYDIFPEALAWKDVHDRGLAGASERCENDPFPRPDGSLDRVRWDVCPWRDSDGNIGGIIMFTEVITDRVEAETALRRSEEQLKTLVSELERAYQLQKEFLNNITHEVRTPLTAVMGYAEMLIDGLAGPVNDEQVQLLGRVLTSSEHLLDVVGSILELSRLRSGNFEARPTICKPATVIDRVLASVTPQAQKKGLSISVHCPNTGQVSLFDENMLAVILSNLISNAVKFTDHGGIELSIESEPSALSIIVVDTGRGIPETSLARIFDEFEQVSAPRKHKPNGFGIGLAIVSAMIHAMEATLTVSSAPDLGTAFTINIPNPTH